MARKIAVEIVGDSRSLERAFKRSAAGADKFNRQVSKTGRGRQMFGGLTKGAGLLTGALGVGGLASAVRASFDEMGDAQKVSAQTAAALKSTGGAANVTAAQVDKLATALMNKSGTDDEAIKSGENLLLTFTNIRNGVGDTDKIFDQATGTMLDMSVALGQDTKQSAIQLGKALNDPIKGITALRRVGVQFTDGQQKQISAMVKAGDTMGAQKLILAELNREFGGSAKAAGNTLPGQLNKLKQTALNLGGAIAQTLSPEITRIAKNITDWLSKSRNQKTVLDSVKTAASTLGAVLRSLRAVFRTLSRAVGGDANAIKVLIGLYAGFKILTIASRIGTLAGSFRGLRRSTRGATGATRGLTGSLVGKAGLVGAVGLLSFELTTAILKLTGLDKYARQAGAGMYDFAADIGLVNDQLRQFEGKTMPGQKDTGRLRQQAARLEAGGLTPRQTVNRLARQNPTYSRRDLEVIAGVRGSRQPTVNINTMVVNPHNYKQLTDEITKRARRTPRKRHGN